MPALFEKPDLFNQQDDLMDAIYRAGPAPSPKFKAWMKEVDAALIKKTGLSSDDLPDYCYDNDFEDGATPKQAANAAIKAAKDF